MSFYKRAVTTYCDKKFARKIKMRSKLYDGGPCLDKENYSEMLSVSEL